MPTALPDDLPRVNEQLAALSQHILPDTMRLIYVAVDAVREQDVNAQSMPKAMFDQLTANIKNAGAPESLPLLAKTEQSIEIVSGHHRIRAARAAGLKHVLALMYTSLNRSQIAAKQLAHNSISGTSDPELVKRIWSQITDVQARFEAYIDPQAFDGIKPVSFKPVDVDVQSVSKTILLVFLPTQADDFDAAVRALLPKVDVDTMYIGTYDTFADWLAAFKRVRSDLEIVNAPTALAEMARLAVERLDQMREEQGE